ncbi:type I-E CRISPR-associated protein Cas5/CasD [Allonocardiopsis opalescens]|uniref:CRISPR system Cascade subunit CasD n=1 Tax=Allonocardiopsis opalescens TaxID=1144618 RepID=A0A2T0PV57_9ACTN|nr:type I-E CRISPR-associated protein Cas5/CasD [Allonocardiopsis opalescens]PRX95413.1 CRISPR system Cascade subunit CasD [Allonocardiopsis opalescens]
MSVLMLLLAGPLQAWGASSRFARRSTEHAPTKSGVIGLVAAAQGRQRTADLADLAALRFGVRVDQRGTRIRDFQTASHFATGQAMPLSERYYLADAVFVAAFEGDDALIADLDRAVREPRFLPFLGRRSCPPSRPINLGVRVGKPLEEALADEEWHAAEWYRRGRAEEAYVRLDTFVDARPEHGRPDTLRDHPLSFDPLHRRYALRGVHPDTVEVPNPGFRARRTVPEHDPMATL